MSNWTEKRKLERFQIEPINTDNFSLNLSITDSKIPAKILQISIDSALASVTDEKCPVFYPDDQVAVTVTTTQKRDPVDLKARVIKCKTFDSTKFINFYFPNSSGFESQFDQEHLDFLKSQQSFRTNIHGGIHHTTVVFTWQDVSAIGWINNLSISGMDLGFTEEAAQQLVSEKELTMSFKLHGSDVTINLIGTICYLEPIGNNFHCGIKFDKNKSINYQEQENHIASFLINLQKTKY